MAVTAQESNPHYALYEGHAVAVMPDLPEKSVHLWCYSLPFRGLYTYSSDPRDLSNALNPAEFFQHYRFVLTEIARLTVPGRMSCVHCTDIGSGNVGLDHLDDFPGDLIRMHEGMCDKCGQVHHRRLPTDDAWEPGLYEDRRFGTSGEVLCPGHLPSWRYVARHDIWKEPLGVRNRTMARKLAHRTACEDSSRVGNASSDYLLVFRRRGKNPVPVENPRGFMSYAGAEQIPAELLSFRGFEGDQKKNRYSHWVWQRYASSHWSDVRLKRTVPYETARETDDETHVHPLQLDVIERCVALRSNPGEVVADWCSGVGSTPYQAVAMGRKGLGIELKAGYHRQAVLNVASALEDLQNAEDDQWTLEGSEGWRAEQEITPGA